MHKDHDTLGFYEAKLVEEIMYTSDQKVVNVQTSYKQLQSFFHNFIFFKNVDGRRNSFLELTK